MIVTKLKKQTFKHIEAELYCYHDTLKEIEFLRREIIYSIGSEDNMGRRSNRPNRPTERIATKLATHKRLNQLEQIANAIQKVYANLPDGHKKLVKLKYWTKPQKFTWDGIAAELNIGRMTAFRWRDEVIYAIAEAIGWR